MAYDDPPLFTLLFRVVLCEDRFVEDLQCLGIILFVSLQRDQKLDHLLQRVLANLILFCRTLGLVLYLDHGVPIADICNLLHLLVADRYQLGTCVIIHIHEVRDLLDASFRFESTDKLLIKTWQL